MAAREGEGAKRYEAAGANTFVRGKIFTAYWNLLKLTDWGEGSWKWRTWDLGIWSVLFFFFHDYRCV